LQEIRITEASAMRRLAGLVGWGDARSEYEGGLMAVSKAQAGVSGAVPSTYRAAVVHRFREPLTIEQVPSPDLGPGQVRVKVEAAGLCATDIHAAHGDWPVKPTPPFVPGHEGVGIVAELGPGVSEVSVGDRVAMPWLAYACGVCDYCVSGRETLCHEQKNMGYSIDGGFGEYATAFARYVVGGAGGDRPARRRAADVRRRDDVQGGGSRWNAVHRPGCGLRRRRPWPPRDPVRGNRRRARGGGRPARREARARARAGGGVHRNASKEDAAEAIQRLGGADQSHAIAASPKAFQQAFGSLRRGGTLVFVGLPADNQVQLPIFESVLGGIRTVGSIVGTRADLREVFELHAAGRTRVIREVRPLDTVNESMADVEAGLIAARVVFEP
jgi:alcohol dehydrogenase, propanol-preferring